MLRVSLRKSFDKLFDNVLIELGKRSGMAAPKVDGGLNHLYSYSGGVSENTRGSSNDAVLCTGTKVVDGALLGSFAIGERGVVVPPRWSMLCGPVHPVSEDDDSEWRADSVRRKRKKKMNKHKHAKRRKLNRHKR
ncbi:hypothetical protein M9434_000240 [Picochlorum sp. BPE23]|nr:hypothetical protein M9434_000240 [Picochlorum sp. BPE23]KAI8106270.1 hypothetical protein M9435_000816 [Picochlorum sp. BPE23]